MGRTEDSYKIDLAHDGDFKVSSTGDLQTIKGLNNLKQALYNRLVTPLGAIVHRPEYGIGIQRYKSSTITIEEQRQIALDVQDQFTNDPRVEKVSSVRVEPNENRTGIYRIFVKIKPIGYNELEEEFFIED
jgi:phage baseplate assembly protein W